MDLADDTTSLVTRMGFVPFYMPLDDVLELHNVFIVPCLTKNLLSASTMKDMKCVAKFDDQQVIIRNGSHEHGQILSKGMQEGGLYRLLTILMKCDALV